MVFDFSGKTAIVTGGTRGIGKRIVQLLCDSGCKVVYTGTKKMPEDPITSTQFEQLDLFDDRSIERFFTEVIPILPRIDILVNNAGVNKIEPVDKISDDHWEQILKVNLSGSMRMTREVAKRMMAGKRGGRILNISSIFGIVSKAQRDAYSASKAGLIGLTRASALDLAPDNILVNALCPGLTLTELTLSILSEKEIAALRTEVPLGRFADVTDIANAALFLCSDLNTYITGQTLIVDGGFTIK